MPEPLPALRVPRAAPIGRTDDQRPADMVRTRAGNPFVARCIAEPPGESSKRAAIVLIASAMATVAMLVRCALAPGRVEGLFAVALIGTVAWRSAAAMVRVPSSAKWRPANDNPPHACLPPHLLW